MDQPKRPLVLYAYYLIAVIGTLFGSALLTVIFPHMNDIVFIAMFPVIFMGILLIGYFRWRRYRKIIGLKGKDAVQYGLGSIPAGLVVGTAKDLASGDITAHKKGELPKVVVLTVLTIMLILFMIVVKYFGS